MLLAARSSSIQAKSAILSKQLTVTVFKLGNDGTFESVGEVNQFTSLIWPDKYSGYGTFELWAPITEENAEYLKKGNIVWCGGENAAIIEIVKSTVSKYGEKTFDVKGRTLEMLLATRIIWGTYSATDKYLSTIMYEIVDKTCINPTNTKRKIPFLELAPDAKIGGKVSYQKTGGEVYDSLSTLASSGDLGFDIKFDPRAKKLTFEVTQGVDRTINQDVNDYVEFSTDLEDLLSSSYYMNSQDEKCVAFVQGEESSTERKSAVAGDDSASGFLRKEMYVDARDIQSLVIADDGSQSTIPEGEYIKMLTQRGTDKLAERQVVETFEASIRVEGEVQYKFGVDYKKGDKVTVRDKQLGVVVSARITEVKEEVDTEYALILTFGYSSPTIMQKVKQQIG